MSSDMASQMAKSLCRAPVEPSAVNMHDGLTGPRTFGPAPPPRNTANMVSFVDNSGRRRDALHDGVKRNSGRRSLKPSLVGFDDSAHRGHRSLIFFAEWMEHGPSGRDVIFDSCLHDVPPAFLDLNEALFS
jgi:hypothetical protein